MVSPARNMARSRHLRYRLRKMAEIANLHLTTPKKRLAMMIGPAATDTGEQSCAVETRQSAAASLFGAGKPAQAIPTTMEVEAKWCERWRP